MKGHIIPAVNGYPDLVLHHESINRKPVFEIEVKTVLSFDGAFGHKKLCDRAVFSLGSACVYSCKFCYVEAAIRKHPAIHRLVRQLERRGLGFQDAVIRRRNALGILRDELREKRPKIDRGAHAVVFTSPLVDPAATPTLARETAEACILIFESTAWDVRILSKSSFLPQIAKQIPEKYRDRVIYGVSTGTLRDDLTQSFEQGTPLVSKRLESLHWLQDNGYRTYGMICPSLPQDDYDRFAEEMAAAIRVEKCEHVWAEVLNVRGDSLKATRLALQKGGFMTEANRLNTVFGPKSYEAWDAYARATFEAHTKYIPPAKLRFLQYPKKQTLAWWKSQEARGAVLLGKIMGH
jgi:DNA repair photolyase